MNHPQIHPLVQIDLNGRNLMVSPEKTILEVAGEQGIEIPTLCHDPRLEPYGSCWVCVVRVEGAKGFVPACSTKVRQGMRVVTDGADIRAARRMALELLLSGHHGDCKAPCTQACPAGIDVQGYVGLIANGRYAEALRLIKENNPFPAVCGRVCPRPCEEACRRNLVDEPVGIDWLKRFVADLDLFAPKGYDPVLAPRGRGKAAVVGGGPAGLSAAYYLARQGVAVTVFEAEEKAGGMLRYGIPDYRLPQDALDREIQAVLRLGVTLKTGVRLGRDVQLEGLRREYDAVVLALGAWKGRAMRIQGEDHPAVLPGIAFLKDAALGKKVPLGRRVAVIGGGNTAIDAARVSLRMGAREVGLFYRRTEKEMPASAMEIHEAEEEGVRITYLVAPVGIEQNGQADGHGLKSIRLIRMELGEPDASGRRRPVEVPGSEFEVPVDNIITAIGQYSDTRILESAAGLVDEKGNLVCTAETGETRLPGVFAAGDVVTGPDIAIRAIAGGRRAAASVLAWLEGRRPQPRPEFLLHKEDFGEVKAEDFQGKPKIPREKMKVLEPQTRAVSFAEIEQGLTEEQARREAARCLECGCQDVHECRLKSLSQEHEAVATRFLGEVQRHPIDSSHPFIERDPAKCILCGRCIRICLEVQGIGVLGYIYRGFKSVVAPAFDTPLADDPLCIGCGQCISTCPVGALTEKQRDQKPVPLAERVEEGYCALCSVVCPVEYRTHGSLPLRVKERFADGNGATVASTPAAAAAAAFGGTLCRKGRFEQGVLGLPESGTGGAQPRLDGRAASLPEVQAALKERLGRAKKPLLRISPLLAGEAIDRLVRLAVERKMAVAPLGLEGLERDWARLAAAPAGAAAEPLFETLRAAPGAVPVAAEAARAELRAPSAAHGAPRLVLLVGSLDESNNVAFTEALRWKRKGGGALWAVGPQAPIYTRHFDRIFPRLEELDAALRAAAAAGVPGAVPSAELRAPSSVPGVEVLVNPEELARAGGKAVERQALAALLAAPAGVRVTLFWNSRNGGYLLRKLAEASASGLAGLSAGGAAAGYDLVLAASAGGPAGAEDGAGEAVVRWGLAGAERQADPEAGVWIPLPRQVWIGGYTEPSGRRPLQAGLLDGRLLGSLTI